MLSVRACALVFVPASHYGDESEFPNLCVSAPLRETLLTHAETQRKIEDSGAGRSDEQARAGSEVAIPGLDSGIPAGMTARR